MKRGSGAGHPAAATRLRAPVSR